MSSRLLSLLVLITTNIPKNPTYKVFHNLLSLTQYFSRHKTFLLACLTISSSLALSTSCSAYPPSSLIASPAPFPRQYTLEIIERLPHNDEVFTQGLVLHNGILYESGGLYNESTLRRYASVNHAQSTDTIHSLADDYFAEGLTFYNNTLIQLTWKEGIAFQYDLNLNPVGTFTYSGEGWGICTSDRGFITSDGSATLTLRRYFDFAPAGTVTVRHNGTPITKLNALTLRKHPADGLEYVYANVWFEDYIIEIDALTGIVTAHIDASRLPPQNPKVQTDLNHVLNGIEYDPRTDTFWITGKKWTWLYHVRFVLER